MTTADALGIIAHRGYSAVAPENTLAAVEEALAWGVDAVEWDVRVSSDGVPVIIHDETVDRTTNGSGRVADLSLGELEALDAGSWFGPEFRGERIPTLEAGLEAVRGRVDRIFPEIKGCRSLFEVDLIVAMLSRAGFRERATVISLDWTVLERARSASDAPGLGFIVDGAADFDEALRRASEDGNALVDLRHDLVLEEPWRVERARAEGVDTAVWTVDAPEEARRILDAGVRWITTNQVAELLSLVS